MAPRAAKYDGDVIRVVLILLGVAGLAVSALFIVDWQSRRTNQVRVVEVPFTSPGSDAVTTGRIIFVQSDKADSADLLAHELVHVCQWEEQGISFLWNYVKEYGENVVELQDLDAAYVELSFEEEARLGEIDCDLEQYVVP